MELDGLAGQVAGRVGTCPVTVAMPSEAVYRSRSRALVTIRITLSPSW